MPQRLVRLPPEVQGTVRSLHPEQKRRVCAGLDLLQTKPEAGKELKGDLVGWRSLRIGRLRLVYRVTRTTLDVAGIGPRSSIYLDAVRLARAGRR